MLLLYYILLLLILFVVESCLLLVENDLYQEYKIQDYQTKLLNYLEKLLLQLWFACD